MGHLPVMISRRMGHTTIAWFGSHGSGMLTIQGGGTVIWLGNCLVPDICRQQADCHFKQYALNSDLHWEGRLLMYKRGGMPAITSFQGQSSQQ